MLRSEEEEPLRVARVSLQVLEQTARELVEEDWDLDEALWVLAQVCKVEPQLQLKVGLYRHGGVVGVLGGTLQRPWLTELIVRVLSAVAPGAEYTSLWLSNSTVQPVRVDSQNLQGSTNVVLPVKLPPVGGEQWVELQPGDVPSGVVEERVDGKGHRFLGVTHQLQKGKPFVLDPRRRHATAPWEGERVVLVAYTVNTLGKVPESDLQALESLGFPLPGSTRLPLKQQQDVRRLDAFDCFEEEPLREAQEGVERVVGGDLLRGGGWKETQNTSLSRKQCRQSKHFTPFKPLSRLSSLRLRRRLCQVKACGLNRLSSANCGSHFRKKRVKCARAGRETWLGMTFLSCVSPSLCTLPTLSCCLMPYRSP